MIDYHGVVTEIRGVVRSADTARSSRLEGLAKDYAEACEEVNVRLAQCRRLLGQGLRSEAIHVAQTAPDLLDAVQALEFNELPAWREIVVLHSLTMAQALDMDSVEFLHDAFAEGGPIQGLLRQHRRLALARCPLRERIGVLRQLVARDPNNPIWIDDLGIYQTARLVQIKVELADAIRRRDLGLLASLNEELDPTAWAVRPPESLIAAIRDNLASFHRSAARIELTAIGESLNEAFAALDVERGRQARAQWIRMLPKAAIRPDDRSSELAEPALIWLAAENGKVREESDYLDTLADLEFGLDDLVPRAEFDRLMRNALGSGRVLPDALGQRCRQYEERLGASRRRRARLALVAAAAAVVVVSSTSWVAMRRQWRGEEAHRAAEAIVRTLNEAGPTEARVVADRLILANPDLARAEEVAEVDGSLRAAETAEGARKTRLERAIQDLEARPVAREAAPAAGEVRSLAKTEAEVARVDQIVRRRERELLDKVAQADRDALARLRPVEELANQVDASLASEADEDKARTILREMDGPLHDLRIGAELLSDGARDSVRAVTARADSALAKLNLRTRRRDLGVHVTTALGSLPDQSEPYVSALQDTIRALPDQPRSADFRRVIDERTSWSAALELERMAHGWGGKVLGLPPRVAVDRVALCTRYLDKFPKSPDANTVRQFRQYYESITRRVGESGLRDQLLTLFSDFLVENIDVIEAQAEKRIDRYYSKKPSLPDSNTFHYLTGFDGKDAFESLPLNLSVTRRLSPQSQIAAGFKQEFRGDADLVNWDTILLQYAGRIAAKEDMDEILRVVLLKRLLACAGEGSVALQAATEASRLVLEEEKNLAGGLCWMDPKNEKANAKRALARETLARLPDWKKVAEAASAANARLAASLATVPRAVGWLARERGWTCQVRLEGYPAGELRVLVPDGERIEWKAVGKVAAGRAIISTDDPAALVEGRLVFLVPDNGRPAAAR